MSQAHVSMVEGKKDKEKDSRKERKRKVLPEDFVDGEKRAKDDLNPKKKKLSGEPLPIPPLRVPKDRTPKTRSSKKTTSTSKQNTAKRNLEKTLKEVTDTQQKEKVQTMEISQEPVTPKSQDKSKEATTPKSQDKSKEVTTPKSQDKRKETPTSGRFSGEYVSPPPLRDKHLPPQVSLINHQSKYFNIFIFSVGIDGDVSC